MKIPLQQSHPQGPPLAPSESAAPRPLGGRLLRRPFPGPCLGPRCDVRRHDVVVSKTVKGPGNHEKRLEKVGKMLGKCGKIIHRLGGQRWTGEPRKAGKMLTNGGKGEKMVA